MTGANQNLETNSRNTVASVGENKPFRYNTDTVFVLAPPEQPRVAVNVVEYSGESDAGPFPVPGNIPFDRRLVWFEFRFR